MKTWEDYKEHVKKTDSKRAMDMKESEELAEIITAMIAQRNALGLTQRQLAQMCEIPQSSLARIESCNPFLI
jgi:predicted XRE-type DNA-binding protein